MNIWLSHQHTEPGVPEFNANADRRGHDRCCLLSTLVSSLGSRYVES
jgi:hypothetical protein